MNKKGNGRITFFLVLGIETVFFLTAFMAYIALRNEVTWNIPHTFSRLAIPTINTFILLISAVVVWVSNRAIRLGRQLTLRNGLLITLILGVVFVAGQMFEFNHAGFLVNDPSFGGVFFTLMGFHAVHVLAGVVFLALVYMRTSLGDFSSENHEPVNLGAWFWYYVCLVWVVLFTALYII